eukprot:8337454-Pyramimonas_sp.AAC.1
MCHITAGVSTSLWQLNAILANRRVVLFEPFFVIAKGECPHHDVVADDGRQVLQGSATHAFRAIGAWHE